MDLRPELLPPLLDTKQIAHLGRLAAAIDGARPEQAHANLSEFNRLAGTSFTHHDFQYIYEAEDHENWVRRILTVQRVKPVPTVTREELSELVRRITFGGADMEAYMAIFDANVPLPKASMLVFYPPDYDNQTNTWGGGRPIREYEPTAEQIVRWALEPNARGGPAAT